MPLSAIIKTKILIPRRRKEVLSRPRLLNFFRNVIDVRLLIVSAPAGYGKTSLLVDYAGQAKMPVCWFSLDLLDCDFQRFVMYFVAALQQRFPRFGKQALSVLAEMNQDHLDQDAIIAAIVNDAYENITEHFVYVIDDFHLVQECAMVETFMNRMVQEVAENCHFLIASRVQLTLPDLSLLVARDQVAGLSFDDLAFTPVEIKQLLSQNYSRTITDTDAQGLADQTEGWITGLLLSAQLSPKGGEYRARIAKVSGVDIYEYLARQVLGRQSPDLQRFLLRTSLLEEFDARLCEKVIGRPLGLEHYPWRERISRVLRENLFVLSIGEESFFIRYHHLFRDFLQGQMRAQFPEEAREIEHALSLDYEERAQWEKAYTILSSLGNQELVADLIHRAAPFMINNGRLTTLSSWLDGLTDEKYRLLPELLSIRATIATLRGALKESLELFNLAVDALRPAGAGIELGRALVRRSILQKQMGHYTAASADAREAIALLLQKEGVESLLADAHRAYGLVLLQQGELTGALDSLDQSRRLFSALGQDEDCANVLMEIGLTQRRLGNYDHAEEDYKEAIKRWQVSGNAMWQAIVQNNLGVLQHIRGLYEQAALSFERSLQYARLIKYARSEANTLISLGDLYRDLGLYPEARQAYAMLDGVSGALDEPSMAYYRALSLASLLRGEGKFSEAEQMLNAASEKIHGGPHDYETSAYRLEQWALKLREGELDGAEDALVELVEQFDARGEITETLRARLLLVVVALKRQDDQWAAEILSTAGSAATFGASRNILVQIGLEYQALFTSAHSRLPGLLPLEVICRYTDEFVARAPEFRKNIRRQTTAVQFTSYQMTIAALGKMQVWVGGRLVSSTDWQSQTARDLFFYILANPGGVTKEQVGAEFWPESSGEELKIRFKNLMYRLRRAVGNEAVAFSMNEIYKFDRAADYSYDVEQFDRALALAQDAGDEETRMRHLKTAMAVYAGPFLPKLDYAWALPLRQHYEEQFVGAGLALVELLQQQSQYLMAVQYVKQVLAQDSCNEPAYQAAMRAYAALGNRALLKRTFDACKQALKNELDVTPGGETVRLYESLIQ